jgi:glucosylglycerate synthase
VETDSVLGREQERNEQVDSADLVVGILGEIEASGAAAACEALRKVSGAQRIAVLHDGPAPNLTDSTGSPGSASLWFLPFPAVGPDTSGPLLSVAKAYEAVFAATQRLGARGCCVVASHIEGATPDWICELMGPLLEREMDLVVPHYAKHRLEGLLNSSIISPLLRSLYGKRIHNPMGPDLAVSRRLVGKMLGAQAKAKGTNNGVHPLASLAPTAVCGSLQVCEVCVGSRVYRPTDWTNVSLLLTRVLDPVFVDMERNAACWQRTRGSTAAQTIGEPIFVSQTEETVDTKRLVESFQLGNRELQELWSIVLPPATLFELRKLLRSPAEQFHMDDALWARIVYDFALAHRLRTISRDHLLKSMTPLYLGWVASYTTETQTVGALALDQRLERLAAAYEAAKPYLVSRWRWPDRFSP